MGMAELERALEAVRSSDRARFKGPRDPVLVAAAEEAVGFSFPPTYRRFVSELGFCAVGGQEFYGVFDENFENSLVPDGISYTLRERERWGFPKDLMIVGDTGMGEWYVLDISKRDEDEECPVFVWEGGMSEEGDELEFTASDFGSFFWDGVLRAFGPE